MWFKLLILSGVLLFVAACATTPKEEADSSGSGDTAAAEVATTTASSLESVDYTSDAISGSGSSIVPGSQEDLIVNVGDRVFFGFDSFSVKF